MPYDLDPERFTLRQAAQARDDFAQVMDELDFVKELIARLRRAGTKRLPLADNARVRSTRRRARDRLDRAILPALPLRAGFGPLLDPSALQDLLVTAGQQCRERLTLDAQ